MTALCLIPTHTFRTALAAVHAPWTASSRTSAAGSKPARKETSDPPPLAWAATVMRDRCHVADGRDREADGLQRAQRAFPSGTRPADFDIERLHTVVARLPAGILGRNLRSVGRGFAAALEALAARGGPGDRIALRVRDGDHRVVERRGNVGNARGDVLTLLTAGARRGGGFRHDP